MANKERLKSFHFDVGNSTTGPIGFCARVRAKSKEEALKILKSNLPEEHELGGNKEEGIEYLNVYFNEEKVFLKDIDDGEDVDEDEEGEGE